jgi:hypothetical protein
MPEKQKRNPLLDSFFYQSFDPTSIGVPEFRSPPLNVGFLFAGEGLTSKPLIVIFSNNQITVGLFTLNSDHLLTAVKTVRRDVVTEVNFTRLRFDGRCRVRQMIVATMLTALRSGLLILLDCHVCIPHLKTKKRRFQKTISHRFPHVRKKVPPFYHKNPQNEGTFCKFFQVLG